MYTYLNFIVCFVSVVYLQFCECLLESSVNEVGNGRLHECGRSPVVKELEVDVSDRIIMLGGKNTVVGEFPWHAGIYLRDGQDWEQKCGGSLITHQFVLTAAHCVVGEKETDIRVSLGKYRRLWYETEIYEQKRKVSRVFYPSEFEKPSYYFDIALLQLSERITPGGLVMPVCTGLIGYDFLKDKELLIVGWGHTESGRPSKFLQYNEVTFVPKATCKKYVPSVFSLFDKFCTMKNSSELSIAQRGDSGGGLTVVRYGLHFILGIVSVKLTEKKMTYFTNITWPTHLWWIENHVRKIHSTFSWSENTVTNKFLTEPIPSEDGCKLPVNPEHGVYQLSWDGNETSPACRNMSGVVVPSDWQLKYSCDVGYGPSNSDNSVCDNGIWRNTTDCIKYCPPLVSTSLNISCYYEDDEVLCSRPSKPGTIAEPRCKESYIFDESPNTIDLNVKHSVYECLAHGEWNHPLFNCTLDAK